MKKYQKIKKINITNLIIYKFFYFLITGHPFTTLPIVIMYLIFSLVEEKRIHICKYIENSNNNNKPNE